MLKNKALKGMLVKSEDRKMSLAIHMVRFCSEQEVSLFQSGISSLAVSLQKPGQLWVSGSGADVALGLPNSLSLSDFSFSAMS